MRHRIAQPLDRRVEAPEPQLPASLLTSHIAEARPLFPPDRMRVEAYSQDV